MLDDLQLRAFNVANQRRLLKTVFVQQTLEAHRRDWNPAPRVAVHAARKYVVVDVERNRRGAMRNGRMNDLETTIVSLSIRFEQRQQLRIRFHHNVLLGPPQATICETRN